MRVYDTFPNQRKVCQMELLLFLEEDISQWLEEVDLCGRKKWLKGGTRNFFLVFGFSMTGGFCHDSNAMKAPALCKRRKNALWPFVLR